MFNSQPISQAMIELLQKPVKDHFCTVSEAASLLGKSERRIRELIEIGWLYASIKVGTSWLVSRAALDNYIELSIQEGKAGPRPITAES